MVCSTRRKATASYLSWGNRMPVGAIIGGVASIGGALLSSHSNSKAIDKASDAQAAATKEATQLQRDVYNQNVGYQTPYLNTGNAAMAQINALLGLNVPQSAAPAGTQGLPSNEAQQPVGGGGGFFGSVLARAWQERIASGQARLEDAPAFIRAQLGGAQQQARPDRPTVPAVTQPTAQSAYDQFKNYTGYRPVWTRPTTRSIRLCRQGLAPVRRRPASPVQDEPGLCEQRVRQLHGLSRRAAAAWAGRRQCLVRRRHQLRQCGGRSRHAERQQHRQRSDRFGQQPQPALQRHCVRHRRHGRGDLRRLQLLRSSS
jgi:hypothetical protein